MSLQEYSQSTSRSPEAIMLAVYEERQGYALHHNRRLPEHRWFLFSGDYPYVPGPHDPNRTAATWRLLVHHLNVDRPDGVDPLVWAFGLLLYVDEIDRRVVRDVMPDGMFADLRRAAAILRTLHDPLPITLHNMPSQRLLNS